MNLINEWKALKNPGFANILRNSVGISIATGITALCVWGIAYGMQEFFIKL